MGICCYHFRGKCYQHGIRRSGHSEVVAWPKRCSWPHQTNAIAFYKSFDRRVWESFVDKRTISRWVPLGYSDLKLYNFINDSFEKQMAIYWANLSRSTNLFVILNISMFFLTEMVIKKGYYYTFYSLGLLMVVKIGLLFPSGLLNRFWFYCSFWVIEMAAVYFLAASIWYWVITNRI